MAVLRCFIFRSVTLNCKWISYNFRVKIEYSYAGKDYNHTH